MFEQLPTKTVRRPSRSAATASDRRGYPTPHTLSSGVRWSTESSIITGHATHPWTHKAGHGVDSPSSEVRWAPAERAVGRSGTLSRSWSAIRVLGCIAGHKVGARRRPGLARDEIGDGPRRPDLARHVPTWHATFRPGWPAAIRPRTERSGLARGDPAWHATNRRSGAVSHLGVRQDGMAGGDCPGESSDGRSDPGPDGFAQAL